MLDLSECLLSFRSSRLSRLRSPLTSSAPTSSNCSRRASASPSLTVSPRHLPRRSSLLTGRRPLRRGVYRRSMVDGLCWTNVDGIERGKSIDEEGSSGMRWTIRLMIHSDGRKACHELARFKRKTKQFYVTLKQSNLHGVSPVARLYLHRYNIMCNPCSAGSTVNLPWSIRNVGSPVSDDAHLHQHVAWSGKLRTVSAELS